MSSLYVLCLYFILCDKYFNLRAFCLLNKDRWSAYIEWGIYSWYFKNIFYMWAVIRISYKTAAVSAIYISQFICAKRFHCCLLYTSPSPRDTR